MITRKRPSIADVIRAYRRTDGCCGICGRKVKPKQASLDHIVPLSKGGEHVHDNLQLAHRHCNLAKADKLPLLKGQLIAN